MTLGSLNTIALNIPSAKYMYQIDMDAGNAMNDEIILKHNESDWNQIVKVCNLTVEDDDWVKLVFRNIPESGTFNLIQDPKDDEEPFFIFWDIPFEDLKNVTPEAEELVLHLEEDDNEGSEEESQEAAAESSGNNTVNKSL